jgi:hypothetical protein
MDERDEQLERFRDAVDRKSAEAEAASEVPGPNPGRGGAPVTAEEEQAPRTERGRPQDVRSVRDKNSGHGKKTADKWNQ